VRNVIAFCIALALVIAIFWLTRSKSSDDKRTTPIASGSAPRAEATPSKPEKIDRVRQLDAPARAKLREQIMAARAKARADAASSSSSPISPPADDSIPLEHAGTIVEALKETPAIVAKCYGEKDEGFEAAAMMSIISDPELGAVIDTDRITDKAGNPIDQKIEDCMRDTIESLALPPMPDRGILKLQYTFKF
jgi:hypothetical protein